MTGTLRSVVVLLRMCARVAPGSLAVALLETVGSSLSVLNALWAGMLVNGVHGHNRTEVTWAVVLLVVTVGANWALSLAGAQARVTLAEKVSFAFEREIARTTAAIPSIEHFERPDYADELQILYQNRGRLGGGLSGFLYTLDVMITAAVVLVMAASIDLRLLLLALTAIPALVGSRLRYRWSGRADEESTAPGRLARHLSRVTAEPDFAMESRVFGLRAELTTRLAAATDRWREPLVRNTRRATAMSGVEEAVFTLVVAAVVVWLLWSAARGSAAPGDIVVAVVAARSIQLAVIDAVYRFGGLAETTRFVGRFLWLQDYAASVATAYDGRLRPPERLRQGIRFEDVTFAYAGAAAPALRDVTVDLPAGAVVALVGENGAGKTTAVKLLTGLYRPSAGRITVDGVDLADVDAAAWAESTAGAFQDFAKLEFTAQESVGTGDVARVTDRSAVRRALREAAAEDVVATLPRGLDSRLGGTWPDGVELSGGQWQKIALGRAMVRREPLLQIFDEPTAALDAATEHALFERYIAAARAGQARGAITVLVTHRFSTVRAADLIVVLDRGRLAESGSHHELMAAGGVYAELYALQAKGYR